MGKGLGKQEGIINPYELTLRERQTEMLIVDTRDLEHTETVLEAMIEEVKGDRLIRNIFPKGKFKSTAAQDPDLSSSQ